MTLGDNSLGTVVMPGSTIHYEIAWSNTGNIALSNVILFDKIPDDAVYLSNSLTNQVAIGSSTWVPEWSTLLGDPVQRYVSFHYQTPEPEPASAVTWVRTKTLSLPQGESGFMRFQARAGYSPAGTLLSNVTFFTCHGC